MTTWQPRNPRVRQRPVTDIDLAKAAVAVSPCRLVALAVSLRYLPRSKSCPRPKSKEEARKRARAALAALMLQDLVYVRNPNEPEDSWVFVQRAR